MPTLSAKYLLSVVQAVLATTGTPLPIARRVTEALVNANLTGHDSHGVIRLTDYLEQVDQKIILVDEEPEIMQETPATAVMDARRGWGHYAVDQAMALAIRKSQLTGIGAIALWHTNHAGRMGEYVESAAKAGYVGLIFAGVGGRETGCAAPFGGKGQFLGSNPIAVGVPSGNGDPFVLDFATTMVARGKIKVARSKGESVPDGWILDSCGNATNNPEDFFRGGSLLHFGGYKGYALSLMTCLLGGLGGAFQSEFDRIGGVFVQAINVSAFQPLDVYSRNTRNFLDSIKRAPRAKQDQEILVAGEPENRCRQVRLREGIPVPDSVWKSIVEAGANRGLTFSQKGVMLER